MLVHALDVAYVVYVIQAELPPGIVYMAGEDVPPKWYLSLSLPPLFFSLSVSLSLSHSLCLSLSSPSPPFPSPSASVSVPAAPPPRRPAPPPYLPTSLLPNEHTASERNNSSFLSIYSLLLSHVCVRARACL